MNWTAQSDAPWLSRSPARRSTQGVRRCLLARFPYGLIYGIDQETIVVVAVAHLHREPRYLVGRN